VVEKAATPSARPRDIRSMRVFITQAFPSPHETMQAWLRRGRAANRLALTRGGTTKAIC
jgi:hypothetical protein